MHFQMVSFVVDMVGKGRFALRFNMPNHNEHFLAPYVLDNCKSHQVGNELKPNLSVHNWQYGGIKVDHFRVEKR